MSRFNAVSNIRVAAIVCQVRNGQLLVATHVPAKSDGLADYSQTTVTGTFDSSQARRPSHRGALPSAMIKTVSEHLGVSHSAVVQCISVSDKPSFHKDKIYYWHFVQLAPNVRIQANPSEIQDLIWNNPQQLASSAKQMTDGRREMFIESLRVACRNGWFGASFRLDLLEQLKPQMKIRA